MNPSKASTAVECLRDRRVVELAPIPRGSTSLGRHRTFTGCSKGRAMTRSLAALTPLSVEGQPYHYYRLDALDEQGLDTSRLPFSLKVLLENLLRHEDGATVSADDIRGLASW